MIRIQQILNITQFLLFLLNIFKFKVNRWSIFNNLDTFFLQVRQRSIMLPPRINLRQVSLRFNMSKVFFLYTNDFINRKPIYPSHSFLLKPLHFVILVQPGFGHAGALVHDSVHNLCIFVIYLLHLPQPEAIVQRFLSS